MIKPLPEKSLILVEQDLGDYNGLSPTEFMNKLKEDGVPVNAQFKWDTEWPNFTYYRLETDREYDARSGYEEEFKERQQLAFLKEKYEGPV